MTHTSDASAARRLPPGRWDVDLDRSWIGFTIRQGLAHVRGRLTSYSASIVVGDTPSELAVDVSIDIASIDTGNARRDNHLRRSYLDLAAHPTATYQSHGYAESGDELVLPGALTVNGVRGEVPLILAPPVVTESLQGVGVQLVARTSIRRSNFAITAPIGALGGFVVSDTVAVEVEIHAARAS